MVDISVMYYITLGANADLNYSTQKPSFTLTTTVLLHTVL